MKMVVMMVEDLDLWHQEPHLIQEGDRMATVMGFLSEVFSNILSPKQTSFIGHSRRSYILSIRWNVFKAREGTFQELVPSNYCEYAIPLISPF